MSVKVNQNVIYIVYNINSIKSTNERCFELNIKLLAHVIYSNAKMAYVVSRMNNFFIIIILTLKYCPQFAQKMSKNLKK